MIEGVLNFNSQNISAAISEERSDARERSGQSHAEVCECVRDRRVIVTPMDSVHQLQQSEMFVISVLINAKRYRETELIEAFPQNV